MLHNPDPDKPSGLISPPPGAEIVVKPEPEDEETRGDEVCLCIRLPREGNRGIRIFPLFLQASGCSTDPSQSNQRDQDGEDSDDSDIHDDQEGMEALIANQTEVSCH